MVTEQTPGGGEPGKGCLVLVVGPSGAGKDSLIDGARALLERDPRFVFPTRMITRHVDRDGEQHVQIAEAAFEQMQKSGAFYLSWKAHGHCYGLPADIASHLATGRTVVANVSRSVIDEARAKAPHVSVVHVTAPKEVVAERLRQRNRERAEEIEERLSGYDPATPIPSVSMTIDTGDSAAGDLPSRIARFVGFLDTESGADAMPMGLSSSGPVIHR
jgi:ribose 1,5-bisphosphokinase